jgi:Acyclic terpene utilisation family protein AtuA
MALTISKRPCRRYYGVVIMKDTICIGGASGFWGDAALATPQLLASGELDFIVYDYLAEVTMSIMARARAADDSMGYATDFIGAVLKPNLKIIAEQGVRVIANAGGVNPLACAGAARQLISEQGLDLKVAVVLGDDLLDRADEFAASGATEMFNGEAFPAVDTIASINAYLGGFPIARALDAGADIVITGRCVDSAVTLGACIHAFGWQRDDFDKLAQASLAGHILECGTQATGGNYTDWETVVDTLPEAGYPMAEISPSGEMVISKPQNSGGAVTVGTVAEQMLYEIGNPQAYLLPDVVCDFSAVQLEQQGKDRVVVRGARGRGAPEGYKVSATYADGFRGGHIWTMYGRDADIKAEKFAETVFRRCRMILEQAGLPDFTETSVEIIGAESHFGAARAVGSVREVDVKLAVKHPSPKGVGVLLKEMVGMALTAPPGLTAFAGARPKPSPVVRLFSMIVPKHKLEIIVDVEGERQTIEDVAAGVPAAGGPVTGQGDAPEPPTADPGPDAVAVSLESLAWGRSGDKGNKANIGIIARNPEFVPYIASQLSAARVAQYFRHFLAEQQSTPAQRFFLPGSNAFNFLLHDVLGGGGVASIRTDAQGKGYAQLLLTETVQVPRALAEQFNLELAH